MLNSSDLEAINGLIMTYFLNLLVGQEKKVYSGVDFDL